MSLPRKAARAAGASDRPRGPRGFAGWAYRPQPFHDI